jgi:DNA-binding GntR family transcriptional regulator
LADQVYRGIRDRILDGDILPGEFLREQELSTAMEVSRTPVREALGRLASEGFLERIPHRGFRVPAEPFTGLLSLYPIVSALDRLSGMLAFPQMAKAELGHLRRINQRLREAMDRADVSQARELNNEFHDYIAQQSGNERLRDLLDDLRSQLKRLETWYYSYREHTEQSIREHDELIDALEKGEHEAALSIFEGNMRLTRIALAEETGLGEERLGSS